MSAVISDCGKFRYRLGRRWGEGAPLLFVMLNPSTADAEQDDATIRRCIKFAQAHDYPQHPLMLPSNCRLMPFTEEAIQDAMQ